MITNEPTYVVDNGQYHFYLSGSFRFATEEVAILLDQEGHVLLKHGTPEVVEATYARMRKAFLGLGYEKGAEDLMVLKGRFDVEELNKIVRISNYVGKVYQQLRNNLEMRVEA